MGHELDLALAFLWSACVAAPSGHGWRFVLPLFFASFDAFRRSFRSGASSLRSFDPHGGVDGAVVRLQWKSGGNIGWGWLAVGVGGEVCFILHFVNFCSGMIFLCAM